MRVPLNWLIEFVEVDADVRELDRRLSAAGLEVEKIDRYAAPFSGVFVAKVLKVEKHPNADRLSLCEVDAGAQGTMRVVCGAPNVRPGMIVPLAKVGARLGGDSPEGGVIDINKLPPLEAATIRGVRSEGMLCSERELRFSADHAGIMALDANAPLGKDVAEYLALDDIVLEIAITPNRGDCLSILGVAREVAALFGTKLKFSEPKPPKGLGKLSLPIEIEAPELCTRYAGMALDEVRGVRSPFWMRRRLELSGMRSVSGIVDVTNYVMLELGQPLHAFDRSKINDAIVVRRAGNDREMVTLDGERRQLHSDDLLIGDRKHPLAIAGVMGGQDSEVGADTTSILLESAWFDPISVARTGRRLGLRSEASYRFERTVDPSGQMRALNRAAELLAVIEAGGKNPAAADVIAKPFAPKEIIFDVGRIQQLLGTELSSSEIKRRIKAVGVDVREAGKSRLKATPPSYRPDLALPEDLAEEVARLTGLEDIPTVLPARAGATPAPDFRRRLVAVTRDLLLGFGITEFKTLAFTNPEDNRKFPGLTKDAEPVVVLNPLSAELSELRQSLVPGLLSCLRFNLNREAEGLQAFEIGRVFSRIGDLSTESDHIALLQYGTLGFEGIGRPGIKADYFTLKGALEAYFRALQLDEAIEFRRAEPADVPYLHPGKAAEIMLGGRRIGFVGELHPAHGLSLDLKEVCAVCELDFTEIISYRSPAKVIEPPPKFPAIRRDVAIVVDRDVPAGDVIAAISQLKSPLLESLELFDTYEGEAVPAGKKSLALSGRYRAKDRTLTDEEVNRAHAAVVKEALVRLKAELRQ